MIVLSEDEDAAEDPFKQRRKIAQIDTYPTISLEISTANVPVSTASPPKVSTTEVSTANLDVSTTDASLVHIRRSASKAKDKGKAIMQE
ncbi:hypothetical protein Tco_0433954, partial [Tanacetum coccineum]